MVTLENHARSGDRRAFADLAEAIDWADYQPEDLLRAIDLALNLELAELAIGLAQKGAQLFPDHERVQRAAQVLAPPAVRGVRPPRAKRLSDSTAWLHEHAHPYKGQWVAVHEGQFLGAAPSLKELLVLIGDERESPSTVVSKVL